MTNRDFMNAAGDIARLAGGLIRERMGGVYRVESKREKLDYVTEVDVDAERLIRAETARRFPGHRFHGEESAAGAAAVAEGDAYTWIVDPLDGTSNFVRRLPLFCVSIALARGGDLAAAAIYEPLRDELFTAAAGEGAYLNGERMRVSTVADFADAVVTCNVPLRTHVHRDLVYRHLARLLPQQGGARLIGSAALCLAYVAAGRTDGHWEYGLNAWDIAAGALLITEAGGAVCAPDGSGFSLAAHDIVASNSLVHHELLQRLIAETEESGF